MEMTQIKLPEFKGKPLIEMPKSVPTANFLEGDFGKAVHSEYKGRAERDYGDASALKVLSYSDGVAKGSNPFAVVLVNQIVREEGLRTATPADLERILRIGALPLREQYEDSALVLRSNSDPNSYLAKDLIKQVNARTKFKMPAMIPLNGLEIEKDSDSNHGLRFKLREDAQIIYAHQLEGKNHGKTFSNTEEDGLPIFKENGNRTLYAIDSGLSGLYLGGYSILDSRFGDLAYSSDGGRVVVVSAEGATQNFDKLVSQLNAEKQRQVQELDKRYAKALDVLKGE